MVFFFNRSSEIFSAASPVHFSHSNPLVNLFGCQYSCEFNRLVEFVPPLSLSA